MKSIIHFLAVILLIMISSCKKDEDSLQPTSECTFGIRHDKSLSTNYPGGLLAFDFDHLNGCINSLGDLLVNQDEDYLGSGTSTAKALYFEGTTVTGDSVAALCL